MIDTNFENIVYEKPVLHFLGAPYPIIKHPRGFFHTQSGLNQIKSDLLVLLLTNPGERVMLPEFGTPLRKLLFEPMTPITSSALSKEVEYVIKNFDKRVTLQSVDVAALYDYNAYQVTVTFYIENLVEPFTADFILSRLR